MTEPAGRHFLSLLYIDAQLHVVYTCTKLFWKTDKFVSAVAPTKAIASKNDDVFGRTEPAALAARGESTADSQQSSKH